MNCIRLKLESEKDTKELAYNIAPHLLIGDVILLFGDLGSGKTFFTKALGKALGINEEIDSPSFVIFKEYRSEKYPLFHFDLYRLKTESELFDLGIFEMLESGVTAIEWPQICKSILPSQTMELHFHFDGSTRYVDIYSDNPRITSEFYNISK